MKKFWIFIGLILLCTNALADDTYLFLGAGRKFVTTNGTRVQLSTTSVPCRRIVVQAETDNTNPVTVGDSTVIGALSTRVGIALNAGSAITLRTNDLRNVWIDSVTDTEGVTYIYYN